MHYIEKSPKEEKPIFLTNIFFNLDFRTVPTVWYTLFFISIYLVKDYLKTISYQKLI
jgi:hypothetical protein